MEATALIPVTNASAKVPQSFRNELKTLGLEWNKLKHVLPDWAECAFASQAGILELKTFLARNVGFHLNDQGELETGSLPPVRFKTTKGTEHAQVTAARAVATACARLVAKITQPQWNGVPSDPETFRTLALRVSSNGWVDLPAALSACWALGIAVLYLPNLPVIGRKMEGMATFVAGRPVIIITKRAQHHPDWLLFLLAHEVGHIAERHFPWSDGEAIVDDTVDAGATGNDQQELEANHYASLMCAPNGKQVKLGRLTAAPRLAELAYEYAVEHQMSPGYVVLNACNNTETSDGKKPFSLGQAALKYLPNYLGDRSAIEICRSALRAHTDTSLLSEDSLEFLEKLGVL